MFSPLNRKAFVSSYLLSTKFESHPLLGTMRINNKWRNKYMAILTLRTSWYSHGEDMDTKETQTEQIRLMWVWSQLDETSQMDKYIAEVENRQWWGKDLWKRNMSWMQMWTSGQIKLWESSPFSWSTPELRPGLKDKLRPPIQLPHNIEQSSMCYTVDPC